jgi:hypothetical protein
MDHLGFVVEDVAQFDADVKRLAARNHVLVPKPWRSEGEGESRLALLQTCHYGQYQLTDPDGTLLDVVEG